MTESAARAAHPPCGRARWSSSHAPRTTLRGRASSVSIQVPANWDDPGGASITFFVRRIVRPDSRGQLWLLAGGPGQAGYGFAGAESFFGQVAPGFDLYSPDHRGTGDSTYLYCPNVYAPGGVQDCVSMRRRGATPRRISASRRLPATWARSSRR